MGRKRAAKEIAEEAAERAEDLKDLAVETAEELKAKAEATVADEDKKKGKKGLFTLLLAGVGGLLYFFKKKRDQELDEALWEEPRNL